MPKLDLLSPLYRTASLDPGGPGSKVRLCQYEYRTSTSTSQHTQWDAVFNGGGAGVGEGHDENQRVTDRDQ